MVNLKIGDLHLTPSRCLHGAIRTKQQVLRGQYQGRPHLLQEVVAGYIEQNKTDHGGDKGNIEVATLEVHMQVLLDAKDLG